MRVGFVIVDYNDDGEQRGMEGKLLVVDASGDMIRSWL